jgi:DNA-binding FadR family transcriptional regulator
VGHDRRRRAAARRAAALPGRFVLAAERGLRLRSDGAQNSTFVDQRGAEPPSEFASEGRFVDDLFALRRAIESMAAEIAATSRTSEGLARIAEAFEWMERFRNGDGDLFGSDVDFHVAILEAIQNHLLAALWARLWSMSYSRSNLQPPINRDEHDQARQS